MLVDGGGLNQPPHPIWVNPIPLPLLLNGTIDIGCHPSVDKPSNLSRLLFVKF